MRFETPLGLIDIVNEPGYVFGQVVQVRTYPFEFALNGNFMLSSIHGVLFNGKPVAVFGDAGGCSTVHQHSLVFDNTTCYVAVGRHVIQFEPQPFKFHWSLLVDEATCFGLHFEHTSQVLIAHGEIEICRFNEFDKKLWSSAGRDIFTEAVELQVDRVKAIDFNGDHYYFDYKTGEQCT